MVQTRGQKLVADKEKQKDNEAQSSERSHKSSTGKSIRSRRRQVRLISFQNLIDANSFSEKHDNTIIQK
jgi:hypothetical protein